MMLANVDVSERAFILSALVEVVGDVGSREHQGFLGTPLAVHPCLGVGVQIGEVSKVPRIQP